MTKLNFTAIDKVTVVSILIHFGGHVRQFFDEHGQSGFYDSRDVESFLGVSLHGEG